MGLSLCFPRARRPRVSNHLGESAGVLNETQKVFVSKKKEQGISKITKRNNMFLEKKKKKKRQKKENFKRRLRL